MGSLASPAVPPRRLLRRASWSLGDQALSSLTNLAVSVVVARSVGAEAFGAFGLAFSTYLLLIGFTRAVTAEPLLVRASADSESDHRRAAADALGTALAIALAASAVLAAVALVLAGSTRTALLALAVVLPGLLVQDTVRYAATAAGRPQLAFANDAVWACVQAGAITAVVATDRAEVAAVTLAWGVGASVAAVVGIAQLGATPAPMRTGTWLRTHRDLIPSFVGEFAARNGGTRLTIFAVAAISGLAAVAGVRAAQVVTGPATVLLLGASMVTVPEAVRLHRADPTRLPGVVRNLTLWFGAGALLLGLAPLAVPLRWGQAALGATWAEARPVLAPQALLLGAMGATSGYVTGLRTLAAAHRSLGARLVIAPLSLVAGVAGAWLAGGAGAVAGLAAAYWVGVAVWRHQFGRAWREHTSPSPVSASAPAPASGHERHRADVDAAPAAAPVSP